MKSAARAKNANKAKIIGRALDGQFFWTIPAASMHTAAMIHVSFVANINPNIAPAANAGPTRGRRPYPNTASNAAKVKNSSSVSWMK